MYHGGNTGNTSAGSAAQKSAVNQAVQRSLMEIFDEFTKVVTVELKPVEEDKPRLNKSA